MADPYLQPDGRTLRNRLGITGDPEGLQEAETARVQLRRAELRIQGFPDAHGFDLLRAVHRHLFQDVYDWAGEIRTTPLAKLHHEVVRHERPSRRPTRSSRLGGPCSPESIATAACVT